MSIAEVCGEQRVVLHQISWQFYETFLAELSSRPIRLTYDRGSLEIMSPLREHERLKSLIGRMIEAMTEELSIPISSGGSTTFKSEILSRGLEPDECYYVANEPRMRGRDDFDPSVDPPPDLAVEVDITSSSLDRMGIYAALSVPEVWRCDGDCLQVHLLQPDGQYACSNNSRCFPFLYIEEFAAFLRRRNELDETSWIRELRVYCTIGSNSDGPC